MKINGGNSDISPQFKISICVLLLALSQLCGAQNSKEAFHPPEFINSENITAESGYFKLEWKTEINSDNQTFELQQAQDNQFQNPKIVYKGPEKASFISGMPDGNYHYRIRQINANFNSGWSSPIQVEVKHHSLSLAWLLFSLGGLVFLATVVLVIHGSIQSAKQKA